MSSIQPTPSNDYTWLRETRLDPETLNSVFGSIASRLKAQEAKVADYEGAIQQLTDLGLSTIADNLAPAIEASRQQLAALEAQAALLADEIATIRAGVVDATSVVVAPIPGLAATRAQAAIAELLGRINAADEDLDAAVEAIDIVLATKAPKASPTFTGTVTLPDGTQIAADKPLAYPLRRSARTANVQLNYNDNGKLIDITAGTFTQTVAAAATLADGWWCYIRNGGTGVIVLDPNGTETVNGKATATIYKNQLYILQSDGDALTLTLYVDLPRVGDILHTITPPDTGYLRCDGATYLQSVWPALYARIGLIRDATKTTSQPVSNYGITSVFGAVAGAAAGTYLVYSSTAMRLTTDNGATWSSVSHPAGSLPASIAFGDGRWILAYAEFNETTGRVDFSYRVVTNLANIAAAPKTSLLLAALDGRIFSAYKGGVYYLGCSANLYTSSNGSAWTLRWDDLAVVGMDTNGTRTIIVGGQNSDYKARRSDNGFSTWVQVLTDSRFHGIKYDGQRWLVGRANNASQSVDGDTWSALSSAFTFSDVALVRGVYAFRHSGGVTYRSADLLTTYVTTSGAQVLVAETNSFLEFGSTGLRRKSLYSYNPVTEFAVPVVADLSLSGPNTDAMSAPAWMRAAA